MKLSSSAFSSETVRSSAYLVSLALLIAGSVGLRGAPKEPKDNNGKASTDTSFEGDVKPGKSDVVKVGNGKKVQIDLPVVEWDAVDLSGGIIEGANTLTLANVTSRNKWTAGDITGTTINSKGLDVGAGGAKKISGNARLNLEGTTTWTAEDITTGGGAILDNKSGAVFETSFDGSILNDLSGALPTFTNAGTFRKTAGGGSATSIASKFDSTGTVDIDAGTLKLQGGGKTSGNVDLATGAKVRVDTTAYEFENVATTGDGTIEVGGNATFKNTTGGAKIAIEGGTAAFNSNKSTASALTFTSGTLTSDTGGSAEVGALTWTGGNLNGKVKSIGATNISGTQTIGSAGELTVGGSLTASGTVTNQGKFIKDGAGTTDVGAALNSTGTLTAQTGTLRLTGGGKAGGNVNIANDAKLQVTTTDYTFENATIGITGTGELELNGATTTFKGSSSNGKVSLKGGNAVFDASTTTAAALDLVNGTLTSSGGGSAEVGTLAFSGGNLNGKVKSTTAANLSGGTISSTGELTIGGSLSASGTLTNDGKFIKDGAGTSDVGAVLNSTGTLTAQTGTLRLTGGGKAGGNVNVGNGAKLQVATTNYTFENATITTTGTGELELTGATTTFKGSSSNGKVSLKGGNAVFDTSTTTATALDLVNGTLTSTGGGSAEVSTFAWTGGNLNGKVKSTGSAAISGNQTIESAGELIVGGSLTAGGTLTNDGKFIKDGAGSSDVNAVLNSTGTLTAQTGTLRLTGGGKAGGNVNVGNGAKLQVATTNYTFENATITSTGTGELELTGATTTFKGSSSNGKVSLKGGNAVFDASTTTATTLELANGTLTSAGLGSAEVGTLAFSGGNLNGKVKSTGTTSLSGNAKTINGGELTLGGTTTWDGTTLTLSNNGKIKNEATKQFNVNGDGTLAASSGGTFENAGTLKKAGGTGVTEIQAALDGSGAIEVDANRGKLKFTGGGKAGGNVTVGSGAAVEIGNAAFTFENGALSGDGTVELTGATTTFKNTSGNAKLSVNGGNAKFDATHNGSGKLALANGKVEGGSSASFGEFDWTGGEVTLATLNAGNTKFTGGNGKNLMSGAKLNLSGASSLWDGGDITLSGAAELANSGTFATSFNGRILAGTGGGKVKNTGTFNKSGANTGETEIAAAFENAGFVNVNSGKLKFTGGGRNAGTGLINVDGGAELLFGGDFTLEAISDLKGLKGNGRARVLAGILTLDGLVEVAELDFENGNGLEGNNRFNKHVNWKGGHWNSASLATTTIEATGVLNLDSTGSHDFAGRKIDNYGEVNWRGGNLRGGSNGEFLNRANATFNDLNSGTKRLQSNGSGTFSFTNQGTYRKSGAGDTIVEATFANNSGNLYIDAGLLHFTGSFTHSAGNLAIASGATARFDGGLNLNTGTLTGSGTIHGNVTSGGEFKPGSSPGKTSITGNLTLLSTSTLLLELGGLTQGTAYDWVEVSSTATLAGNLSVSFVSGFQNSVLASHSFTVLTASALTGGFANLSSGRIFTSDGFGSFAVNVSAQSLVLSDFQAIPEPSTYAMLGAGTLAILYTLRRRSRR